MERRTTNRDRDDDRGRTRSRDDDDRGSSRSRDRDDDRGSRSRDRDDDRGSSRGRSRDDDDDRGGRSIREGRRNFVYEGRTRESVDKRASQGANEFDKYLKDSVKMYKVHDKDNVLRILPATWDKPKHYGYDIYVHFGVGPDRQTYLCPAKMKNEPCPICEERALAVASGDEKYAKELEPKRRVLVYVIDRDHEKEGLMAWAMPWTLDRDLCTVSVDRKTGEVLPIDHPDEGYDIEFEKKGAKDRTEYLGVAVARRSSDLGDPRWLDEAVENPLPEMLIYYDYDHIAKAFGGGSGGAKASRDRDDDRGSRDRDDDRGSRRSRDDDRETSRGRDDDRGRSRDDDRGSRSRDDDRGSSRRRDPDPEFTWEQIHDMTSEELDALCEESPDLGSVDPKKFDSDEELADAICEELRIKKATTRRRDVDEPTREQEGRGRLAEMRQRRERGG